MYLIINNELHKTVVFIAITILEFVSVSANYKLDEKKKSLTDLELFSKMQFN